MKTLIFKLALLLLSGFILLACGTDKKENVVIIEGTYHGKNIFVQNPFGPSGIGFCISEIHVNGNRTSDEINDSACEIDLQAAGLKEGDKVSIEILHLKDCEPIILNPEVLD